MGRSKSRNGDVTLREERKPTTRQEGLWVVLHNHEEVGFLTRYANSRTDFHPWKAFRGIGLNAEFVGTFYPEEGGKKAAILKILDEKSS